VTFSLPEGLGHPRRRSKKTEKYFEKLKDTWQRIDDNTRFQETLTDDEKEFLW